MLRGGFYEPARDHTRRGPYESVVAHPIAQMLALRDTPALGCPDERVDVAQATGAHPRFASGPVDQMRERVGLCPGAVSVDRGDVIAHEVHRQLQVDDINRQRDVARAGHKGEKAVDAAGDTNAFENRLDVGREDAAEDREVSPIDRHEIPSDRLEDVSPIERAITCGHRRSISQALASDHPVPNGD